MNRGAASARWIRAASALAGFAAISLWIARGQIASGFGQVLGDYNDSTIETAILEHWFNVLSGRARWSETNYFFPHPGTLGYNDGYFLYGLVYALPRFLGADPYLAAAIVNLVSRLAGFPFFLLFAHRALKIRFEFAVAGAGIFTLGNNLTIHTLHAQLFTVALVPLCGWLLYRAGRALAANEAKALLIWSSVFALVHAAWALTAFYMLWFFTFFCACLAAWGALRHRSALSSLARSLDRRCLLALAAALTVWLIGLVPFLLVYLAKASETGMRSFAAIREYLPGPADILNIGVGNVLYGQAVMALHHGIGFPWEFNERQTGLTPGVVLVFLAACVSLFRAGGRRAGVSSASTLLAQDLAVATIVTVLLSLEVFGYSAWRVVFEAFPGAKAIRVVSRYYIFIAVPAICVGMFALAAAKSRRTRTLGLVVCLFLIAEQLNSAQATYIERAPAAARLDAAKPVPAQCRAFFVLDSRPGAAGGDTLYRHNVDAMLLAEYLDLPTINGFSSFNPPDWNFDHPQRPDYLDRVRAYRQSHRIEGLCALDLRTMKWDTDPL